MASEAYADTVFRKARFEVLSAVAALQREALQALAVPVYGVAGASAWARWQAADAASLLGHGGAVFVAEDAAALAAVGSWRPDPRTASVAFVRAVFVAPRRARSGLGRRLVAAVEADAAASGRTAFRLTASANARPFWEALGYAAVAPHLWEIEPGLSLPCAQMEKLTARTTPLGA